MQDIIIFALVGISLISGVVLLFDVRSLKLPHLSLPHSLPRPSHLLRPLPFFGRSGSSDDEYEGPEYDAYEVYPAVDYGDEDAGSFAASRSPFGAPAAPRRPLRRQDDEEQEEDDDLGFDYKPAALYDDEDAAYAAPLAEAEDVEGAEAGDNDEEDEEEEDDDEGDVDDMMSFFDKAPEVSKVPEALREGVEKVSAAELLTYARELSALLRRTNRD